LFLLLFAMATIATMAMITTITAATTPTAIPTNASLLLLPVLEDPTLSEPPVGLLIVGLVVRSTLPVV